MGDVQDNWDARGGGEFHGRGIEEAEKSSELRKKKNISHQVSIFRRYHPKDGSL